MSSSEASAGRPVATAFNTGGGGFVFEDQVGAWLAAGMAAGETPLGVKVGVPTEVRFQGSASEFFLDDMVVTGDALGAPRWSASVKSFNMLTGDRLQTEFVQAAWRDILADRFQPADRVGLVTGSAAQGTWRELEELIGEADSDQAGIASRIDVSGAFNGQKRTLWRSAKCPTELAEQHGVDVESSPARLLAALLPLRLDLLSPTSQTEAAAIRWCRAALVPQQAGRAGVLWNALLTLVADLRPKGGAVTWQVLADRLGAKFAFQLRPDVAPDWRLLTAHTASKTAGIRDRCGNDVILVREDVTNLLAGAWAVSVLSGPSGCGKTVAAKTWLTAPGTHQALWLSAADLEARIGERLGLTRNLREVLTLAPGEVRVVVDGLDRFYTDEPFAATAALARLAVDIGGRIRLLITSQQPELDRVYERLAQANGPQPTPIVMEDLSRSEVRQVTRAHPDLAAVVVAGGLLDVLRRPKILDLVLRMPGTAVDGIRDEPSIAGSWWQRLAGAGPNAVARQALLRQIAVEQADRLGADTAVDDPLVQPADPLDQLLADGILAEADGRVSFAHDLFDDWTLLHYLRSRGGDAVSVIAEKATLPSWHRAIRLYAASVLRERGVDRWEADRSELDAADQALMANLYLDAVFYAHDANRLLGELWPRLAADSALLVRLLRRFKFSATVPDYRTIAVPDDRPELAVYAAAQARLPVWPLWLPVLRILAAEHETAVASAAPEVAAIADLWLRRSPDTWPARDHAAVIGIAVGQHIVAHFDSGGFFDDQVEPMLWRCVIAAGAVEPDAVTAILDTLLPPVGSQLEPSGQVTGRRRRGQRGLRASLLDVDTVMPMLPASPEMARDLVLRAAIESDRHHRDHFRHRLRDDFGIASDPRSSVAIPESGPFRAMLINAEPQGVDVVLALVEHATTNWRRTRNAPMSSGQEPTQESPTFEVLIDGAPVALVGDDTVLAWSHGGRQVPTILAAAMMALEAHLYKALDDGRDITALLIQLTSSRSAAMWGLLADIARHTPALLEGPLAPLVSSADLLDIDQMSVATSSFGVLPHILDHTRAKRARDWNTMDHRKTSLLDLVRFDAIGTGRLTERLNTAREHWAAKDAHRWRVMLAATDSANYRMGRTLDGTTYLDYIPPVTIEEEAREMRNLDRDRGWMMFAHTMRRNITDRVRPSDAELEEQWSAVQPHLDALALDTESPSSISGVEDLRCGYAAWLVLCARDWLRNDPGREAWCRAVLLRPLVDPTATRSQGSLDSQSDNGWDVFCAEALTALWAELPDDVALRAAVARLLLVPRHLTLTTVMRLAASHSHLAEDLRRLEHLTLHCARLSLWQNEIDPYLEEANDFDFDSDVGLEQADGLDVGQEDEAGHGPIEGLAELEAASEAAIGAFANGSLPAEVPRLADWIATTPTTALPNGHHRILRPIDLSYLVASRRHFTTLADAPHARTSVVEFAADLAAYLASELAPATASNRSPRSPYDEERDTLELLADLTISADIAQARTIWEPILALGTTDSSSVKDYLSQVWETACTNDRWTAAFPGLVAEMLDYAKTASTWHGHRSTGVLALAVAGLDKWGHSPVSEQQIAAIRAAVPAWSTWFGQHMAHNDFANGAIGFFGKPSATAFVHDAVRWLADRERSSAPASEQLDTAVTEFLVTISTRTPNVLRGIGPTADNGRQILARLHGRGNAVAGHLLNSLT